jgi:integrase
MKKLPRGIHRLEDGRLRVYVTRRGRPVRRTVTWDLLAELKVPVEKGTRCEHPGVVLAKRARTKLENKILDEKRTGAIAASARTRIADLLVLAERDYARKGYTTWRDSLSRWNVHLKATFGHIVAGELTTEHLSAYITDRQRAEASNATVNRELGLLRKMLRLGQRTEPPRVLTIPHFEKLAESAPRKGFLSDVVYDKLARECSSEGLWLRGMLALSGAFAWRKGEVLNLRVGQLDFSCRSIRLNPGTTKNRDGRVVKMTIEVFEILSVCAAGKGPDEFVFTRENKRRVRDFRRAWEKACTRAGCPDLLFHDLRRTGARNLRRLGVSEGVIMKIAGWRTRSVFDRYNIVDESDLADAAHRLDEKRFAMDGGSNSETVKPAEPPAAAVHSLQ